MNNSWSLAQIWNQSLENVPKRELEPRDYCWASELGGSFYDRYWKMKGRKPTTPPSPRALRKFEAGNLIEWVVLHILDRACVLKDTQEHFVYDEGPIKVTGRLDFQAGGIINTEDYNYDDLPETFQGIAKETVKQLQEKFPDGLAEVNIEVKSCAGPMFDRYSLAPAPQHGLQAFVQAKATNRPTLLVYVSRDDLRICEWKIMPESEKYQKLLDKDLNKMAIVAKTLEGADEQINDPAFYLEPLLQWSAGKFSSNWKVEYSNYLTDYGFERPDEYSKPAKSIALRLNNIVNKLKAGKEMTKVNEKTLEECYEFFPEAEEIINKLREEQNV